MTLIKINNNILMERERLLRLAPYVLLRCFYGCCDSKNLKSMTEMTMKRRRRLLRLEEEEDKKKKNKKKKKKKIYAKKKLLANYVFRNLLH
jgi:hypothetical protein